MLIPLSFVDGYVAVHLYLQNVVPILRFSDEQWKHLVSEKWNKEDSQLLLDYVEEAYGQWETVAGLFRSRYTVEV